MWPFTRRAKPAPAPARPVRREPSITMGMGTRSHKAAQVDRLKASWAIGRANINEIIRRDLPALRARSREAGENDPYARRFKALLRSNVIGPNGAMLQSRLLKANGTLDRVLNTAIEKAWKKWCKAENCDMAGKTGFVEQSRQFISTVAEDGECIVRMVEGAEAGPFGFALQFIDAERLDIHLDREAGLNQNAIRMGIEVNAWSRPVAYWFNSREGDYHYRGRRYERIPAAEIIHAFLPFRTGAWRGLPWSAASLYRLHMLDEFEDASLVNAQIGAKKVGFFFTDDGGTASAPMEGVEEEDGSITVDVEAGEFGVLPSTVKDFKEFNPAYPNNEFPGYVKQILRGVSAGFGISYHKLSGDLEAVNFSSGRLGENDDRDTWKAIQNWVINDAFHSIIFARWAENALLRRMIPGAPADPAFEETMVDAATWQPRRWAHIQPREEGAYRELMIKLRLASRSQFIREDGNDPEEVWDEIQSEEKSMASREIDVGLPADWQPSAPASDPNSPQTA